MAEREESSAGESSETRDFEVPPMEDDDAPAATEHAAEADRERRHAEPLDEPLDTGADEPPDETERRDWDMP